MRRFISVLFAFVLSFQFSASAADDTWTNAEKLNPAVVKQARYEAAKKASAAGDHEKAYDLLSALVFDEPDDPAANYALGREAYATKRFAHAATAFERVLAARPDLGFLHLELAKAHAGAKLYIVAQNELDLALASDPPAELREQIEAVREAIGAAARGWACRGTIRLSVFYNDNVNVGPDSTTIDIAPLYFGATSITSLDVKPDSQPQDSIGLLGALTASGTYDFGAPGGATASGSLEYFGTWLDEEVVKDYEMDFIRGTVGIRAPHAGGEYSLPVRIEHVDRNDRTLVDSVGAVPRFTCRSRSGNRWTTELDVEHKEYPDYEALDGAYMRLGEKVSMPAAGRFSNATVGVDLLGQATRDHAYGNIGAGLNGYAETILPYKSVLYTSARVSYHKYNKRELLAPETRRDFRYQAVLGVKTELSRRAGIDINYRYSGNVCTFDLYEYDRNIVELSFLYRF